MNFGRSKTILLATLFALVLSASAFADTTLYSQAYDNNGYLNASQNDTSNGGLGNFATTYDNWNINPGGLYTVNEVQFTGGYYNGNPGTITGWTVNVYFDNGGIPGTLQHTDHISGNGNETLLGGNIYTYDIGGLGFTEDCRVSSTGCRSFPISASRHSGAGRLARAAMERHIRATSVRTVRWALIRLSR